VSALGPLKTGTAEFASALSAPWKTVPVIWRLPHPFLGMLAFLLVWIAGMFLVGFGVGFVEMIGLTVLASIAFAVVNRRPHQRRDRSS
jgi:hypothetical protein